MKTRFRFVIILLVLFCILASNQLFARPYFNELTVFTQPDKTEVSVILNGDEFYLRGESQDGFTLIKDNTGWICYAKLSDDGSSLISTGIHYTNSSAPESAKSLTKHMEIPSEKRNEMAQKNKITLQKVIKSDQPMNAPMDIKGTVRIVSILVDFPDRPSNITTSEINNAFNSASYNNSRGSIKNWSTTMSNGFSTIETSVIGYFRAPYNTSHYATVNYSATELLGQILPLADDAFDFSTLSANNGLVYSFNVLYAGGTIDQGWATGLWPHAGGYNYTTKDGVKLSAYFMSNMGTNLPLSLTTWRHELGHNVYKWPDTYDYDGDSYCAGGFAMETDIPCAPFRAKNGWLNVTTINSSTNQTYNLPADANTVLRYNNPSNSSEYFIIEYLKKEGWRANAPDEGLLIWHCDESSYGSNNWQDMTPTKHYKYSVEQADGLFQLELTNPKTTSISRDGDLFHGGYKTEFTSITTPNSKWWNGTASDLKITSIGNVGGSTISLNIGNGGTPTCTAPSSASASSITNTSATINWSASGASSYTIYVTPSGGTKYTAASNLTGTSYNLTGLTANKSYTIDVTANCTTPLSKSFSFTTTNTTTCAAPSSASASNITNTSATINWSSAGAPNYYIYVQPSGGTWYLAAQNLTATSYSLTGLTANKSYTIDVYSNCSAGAVAKRFTFTTTNTTTCTAPSSASASSITNTSATINWSASGASSYTIYVTPSGGTKYTAASNLTGTSYNLTGLTANKSYTIDVTANCTTPVSKSFSFTTTNTTTCAAPSSASASNITNTSATINWSSAGAPNYYIYVQPSGGTWYLAAQNLTGTSYNLTGLTANKSYTVDVYSNCSAGAVYKRFTFTTTSSSNNTSLTDGTYVITNSNSGKCLDVKDNNTANYAPIIQYSYTGGSNQKWKITSLGSGYYSLVAEHSGKALYAYTTENKQSIQYAYNSTMSNENWKIVQVSTNKYTLQSKATGFMLDVKDNSLNNFAEVITSTAVNSKTSQQWLISVPTQFSEDMSNAAENCDAFSAFPNPVSSENVTFSFGIQKEQKVTIAIYTLTGKKVAIVASNVLYQPGKYQLPWSVKDNSGARLNAGMYLCKFISGDKSESKLISVIK